MSQTERRPGDVLSYTPSRGWHCREGRAIVSTDGRARDTYWGGTWDAHTLSDDELATAELRFNLGDYRSVRYEDEWLTYALADRGIVTHQGGCQRTYYVREGARPDLATQIDNAREAVEAAERNLESAERRLSWRRDDLAKLEAAAVRS